MPVKTKKIEKRKMSVKIEDGNLLFVVPLDLLVWAQEHRDAPYKIKGGKQMEKWIIGHALDFGGDSEGGYTEFEHYLDKMFDDAMEWGLDWIDMPENEYSDGNGIWRKIK